MGEPSYCKDIDFDKFIDADISEAHSFYDTLLDSVIPK